jgi:hypothetical protein
VRRLNRLKSNGRFERNRGNEGRLRPSIISTLGKITIRVAIEATPGTITNRPSSNSRSPNDRLSRWPAASRDRPARRALARQAHPEALRYVCGPTGIRKAWFCQPPGSGPHDRALCGRWTATTPAHPRRARPCQRSPSGGNDAATARRPQDRRRQEGLASLAPGKDGGVVSTIRFTCRTAASSRP